MEFRSIKKISTPSLFLSLGFFFLLACSPENEENPSPEQSFQISVPSHFPPLPPEPQHNPTTKSGVELGEKLFSDERLSANNQVSCATCHKAGLAFTDGEALGFFGVSGKKLFRNSPSLVNISYQTTGLFWDGGAKNLESLTFAPLEHPDEMAMNLDTLVNKLNAIPEYPPLFQKAFPNQPISPSTISWALAQFQRTLIGGTSRFDAYLNGDKSALSENERKGYTLVQQKCSPCHSGVLFSDFSFHNNGLDSTFTNTEHEGIFQGRFRITNDPKDLGKFKTPSLRNLRKTKPYMHDGRFATLEQVLNHYSNHVKPSPTLDSALFTPTSTGIPLTEEEKTLIISFLETLNDTSLYSER